MTEEDGEATFNFWEEMLDLFKQSVIIQSLITLILLGVVGYLVVTGEGENIPDMWSQLTVMVVGYWIGAKGNFQAVRANREALETMRHMAIVFAARDGRQPEDLG